MNKRILTSLDTLFDTRLACLELINPVARSVLVQKPDYWLREHTDWSTLTDGLVSNEQFDQAYAKRDNEVRWGSVMTGIWPVILKVLTDYDLTLLESLQDQEITLEVNIWPYVLEEDEALGIEEHLKRLLGNELVILFTSIPLEELTPSFITERYSLAILFEFHEWIKLHVKALYQHKANRFVMVGPKLFEHDPRSLTIEEKQKEMTRFRLVHLEFMDFEFVDAKYMSSYRP